MPWLLKKSVCLCFAARQRSELYIYRLKVNFLVEFFYYIYKFFKSKTEYIQLFHTFFLQALEVEKPRTDDISACFNKHLKHRNFVSFYLFLLLDNRIRTPIWSKIGLREKILDFYFVLVTFHSINFEVKTKI